MSSSSSSSFAVNCPACASRQRFQLDPCGPPRMRLTCSQCGVEFGVRRPGTAPLAGSLDGRKLAPAATSPTPASVSLLPSIPSTAASHLPVFVADDIVAGRYRIVRFLAQGGMGEVYEVEDLELREPAALKTVRPDSGADALAVERFRREIQLARKVTHPNVCRIFDVSYHRQPESGQTTIFLTMELLAGETLAERLRRAGALPPDEALPIAGQICSALAAAHEAGVIHRDLKPGNIILVPARGGLRAVVTDFGLARLETGHDPGAMTLTTAGGLVGTPAYLAPEQLDGGEITTAVDIYALGIVLYEMATGTVPFVGDSVLATAVKRLKEAPASPRVHAPHLDAHWETAILRCLEREPAARFASPHEVFAALTGMGKAAAPAPSPGGSAISPAGRQPAEPVTPAPTASWPANWATPARPVPTAPAGTSTSAAPAGGSDSSNRGGGGGNPAAAGVAGRAAGVVVGGAVGQPPGGVDPSYGIAGPAGAGRATEPPPQAATAAAAKAPSPRPSSRRLATLALLALIVASVAVAGYRAWGWRAARLAAEQRLGLPSGDITPRRAVAVLGFRDLSPSPASAWLSPALGEMLSTELGAGGALRVASGEDVARAKLEMQIGQPDTLNRENLARLHRLLGVDQVVAGTYLVIGGGGPGGAGGAVGVGGSAGGAGAAGSASSASGHAGAGHGEPYGGGVGGDAGGGAAEHRDRQIRLDVRLADAATGETTASFSETGTEADLFQLVGHAGERLRHELHTSAAPASRHAVAANPEAARLYSEGLERLRLFDPVAARDLLVQAVRADPASAAAHEALASAWAALGYDSRARDEAKAALDLAAGLPAEDRLSIEGRYREAGGEWDAAADIYSRLVALYPDNPDYGLRLAAAEIQAGHAQAAVAVATALRHLPAPERDDPRIDLTEATAAAATSAFELQHEAAQRAAQRASTLGASLLVAQARLLDCGALRNLGRSEEALAACAEGRRLSATAGDRSGVAEALTGAANVAFDRGRLPEAQSLYEQALTTYRDTGNRGAEGRALNNIAVVLRSQGDLERARQLFSQVLAIAREIGSRGAEAYALNNLAGVLLRRGDLDAAASLYQQSLSLRRDLHDVAGEAAALDNLGVAVRRRGSFGAAQGDHEQALAMRHRIGQKIGEAASLTNLAAVLFDRGDLAGAQARLQEALTTSRAVGSQTATAQALFGLGEVLERRGDLAAARRNHEAALGLRRTLGEKGTAAESRLALAELTLAEANAAPPITPTGAGGSAGLATAPAKAGTGPTSAAGRATASPGAPAEHAGRAAVSRTAMAALADEAEGAAGELASQGAADLQARALSLAAVAARLAGQAPRADADIGRATALLQAGIPMAATPAPVAASNAASPSPAAARAPSRAAATAPRPAAAAATATGSQGQDPTFTAGPTVLGPVQDLRTRLLVELRAAALLPAAQEAKAQAALATVRDEAFRTGLLELQFTARLAILERGGTAGQRGPAAVLATDARTHGFDLLANHAATLPAAGTGATAAGATR